MRRIAIRVTPNSATRANHVTVTVTQSGLPVSGARVVLAASMLTMDMGTAQYRLTGDGAYAVRTPAWLMPGVWDLAFTVRPPGGPTLSIALADRLRS